MHPPEEIIYNTNGKYQRKDYVSRTINIVLEDMACRYCKKANGCSQLDILRCVHAVTGSLYTTLSRIKAQLPLEPLDNQLSL
jgi:hypothetical protein